MNDTLHLMAVNIVTYVNVRECQGILDSYEMKQPESASQLLGISRPIQDNFATLRLFYVHYHLLSKLVSENVLFKSRDLY